MISRRTFLAASSGALVHTLATAAQPKPGSTEISDANNSVAAARGVLERLLGARAADFDLGVIPASEGLPVFRVSASGGTVRVQGSNAVAICRGVYSYLRNSCHAMVTWSGQRLELPARFPDCSESQTISPYRFVQYYNTCTYGYSTGFWDWERWQREIDWMALHGVNMPLAMEGQEAVWQRVWTQMGFSKASLDRLSVGPGYLPWFRMANISRIEGPLPQAWIDNKAAMQRKILDRMRQLDMAPVVPAFAGCVPEGFAEMRPGTAAFTELWMQGMPRLYKTFVLDPHNADLYREIGSRFIREYQATFGKNRYYLADVFNELRPPVREGHRYEDLALFSKSVYGGITSADPDGIWVMQGWLFRNQPEFWDAKSTAAFLSSVPDDRMIVLDISNDSEARKPVKDPTEGNTWKQSEAFCGKQWVNAMIHTFGGNNNVKGNLALIAEQPPAVLASPEKRNLVGWGMDPEGIENNEVVYELMTDIGWSQNAIDLKTWIPEYCRARYGAYPAEMAAAWDALLHSAYSWHPTWNSHHAWQGRPCLDPESKTVETGKVFQQAVVHFLACANELGSNTYYRNDLIELAVQACGGWVDGRLQAACAAHKAGQAQLRDEAAQQAFDMLLRIDALLNVRPDRRLESWVGGARKWARGPEEEAYYDADARRLITCWGWEVLYDYASRVYSGLTRDYYLQRWKVYLAALRQGAQPDLDGWEESWLSSPYKPSQVAAVQDVPAEAGRMLSACGIS